MNQNDWLKRKEDFFQKKQLLNTKLLRIRRNDYMRVLLCHLATWVVFVGICLPLRGGESVKLSSKWRIQPAVNSRIAPIPGEWGEVNCRKTLDYRINSKCLSGTKWEKLSFNFNSFWYEQDFILPQGSENHRLFLDFRRIEGDAIIFVNSKKIGELLRPGGEIEISGAVDDRSKKIRLQVFVTRNYTDISRSFEDDGLRYETRCYRYNPIPPKKWNIGITAPVRLIIRPVPTAIRDVSINTSWRRKELKINIELMAKLPVKADIIAEVFDATGKKVLSLKKNAVSVVAGDSIIMLSGKWPNPITWELDRGVLYTTRVRLESNGRTSDSFGPVRFGFREIWLEGRKIMLNGHELRLRLSTFTIHSRSSNRVDFFRLLGYNSAYIQAHNGLWWGKWSETPIYDDEMLNEMDRSGFAVFLPCPSIGKVREKIFQDVDILADYTREMKYVIRRYRNHSSVLGWIVDMNSYSNKWKAAVSPQHMGKRYSNEILSSGQPKAIMTAVNIAIKTDPTRLAFASGDGNIPSVASTCMYLNFAPLQEREEWPMEWAKNGNMPYMAYEFGAPNKSNFWKGKRFLPTEYFAIYFGDQAYRRENTNGLSSLIEYGLNNGPNGHGAEVDWSKYPMYWEFQRLFVGNTNRAFRTWSMGGGWGFWNVDYGTPPHTIKRPPLYSYNNLSKKYTEKPAWANPNFDIHRKTNQPLLVYIAGNPSHTDKTHIYYSGENICKSLAMVWDGPGNTEVKASWTLMNDGKTIASGLFNSQELYSGNVRLVPFSVTAPSVAKRTDMLFKIALSKDGLPFVVDDFIITVFPRERVVFPASNIAVYDPHGQSTPWLKKLGLKWHEWDNKARDVKLLIVGRNALSTSRTLPFSMEEVKRGLKVLVLEQLPQIWQGLGFRTTEAMPRQVFPVNGSSLMHGLTVNDMRYWRGSPDLLPSGINVQSDNMHALKWTNTHGIASTIPQNPRCAGFNPLIVAEFDLDYSPLLQWRYGSGSITFCSLDLTSRLGVDPAATTLGANILKRLLQKNKFQSCPLVYKGASDGLRLLQRLGFELSLVNPPVPGKQIMVLGRGGFSEPEKIRKFAASGGTVFCMSPDRNELLAFGLKSERRSLQRVSELPPDNLFLSIGPSLLRWRKTLAIDVITASAEQGELRIFANGAIAVEKLGKGQIIYCQLSPSQISSSLKNKDEEQAVETSYFRLEQLLSYLLTNCGGQAAKPIALRLSQVACTAEYAPISHWNVLGPFPAPEQDGEKMLLPKYPGENLAVSGSPDPNVVIRRKDGKLLNWTQTVKPDHKGFVDLRKFFGLKTSAVAFVASTINSDSDCMATLRLGADWRMIVWVNGKEIFRTVNGKNQPNAYQVKIPLKKGANTIGMKIASGSKGFGFYVELSKSGSGAIASGNAALLYANSPFSNEFDPYLFRYW